MVETNEYKKIVKLEAVYDNSDIMTDYFARDTPYEQWKICDLDGDRVTEQKLRDALKKCPQWIQALEWTFERGEKYSMSDHPYGQLRHDHSTGVEIRNGYGGGDRPVTLLISISHLWNNAEKSDLDTSIPATIEELRAYIEGKQDRKEQEAKALKPQSRENALKSIQNSQASYVIDEKGFHPYTQEDKNREIAKLQEEWAREDRQEAEEIKRKLAEDDRQRLEALKLELERGNEAETRTAKDYYSGSTERLKEKLRDSQQNEEATPQPAQPIQIRIIDLPRDTEPTRKPEKYESYIV